VFENLGAEENIWTHKRGKTQGRRRVDISFSKSVGVVKARRRLAGRATHIDIRMHTKC
jgi:hypothetical protein